MASSSRPHPFLLTIDRGGATTVHDKAMLESRLCRERIFSRTQDSHPCCPAMMRRVSADCSLSGPWPWAEPAPPHRLPWPVLDWEGGDGAPGTSALRTSKRGLLRQDTWASPSPHVPVTRSMSESAWVLCGHGPLPRSSSGTRPQQPGQAVAVGERPGYLIQAAPAAPRPHSHLRHQDSFVVDFPHSLPSVAPPRRCLGLTSIAMSQHASVFL